MLIPGNPPTSPEKNRWNPEIHRKFSQNPKTCTQDFKKKSPGHTHTHPKSPWTYTQDLKKNRRDTHPKKSPGHSVILRRRHHEARRQEKEEDPDTDRSEDQKGRSRKWQRQNHTGEKLKKDEKKNTQEKSRVRHQQKTHRLNSRHPREIEAAAGLKVLIPLKT